MAGAGARAKIRGKGGAGATFKTVSLFYKYLGAEQRPDLRTRRDHPLYQAAPQYHCPPAYLQQDNMTYRKNSQVEMGPEPQSVKKRLFYQCCGSKYIVFESGSGSRSGSGSMIML